MPSPTRIASIATRPSRCFVAPLGWPGRTADWRWATLGFVVLSTSTTLIGPLLLRYGIDDGIRADDAGALNLAIGLYVLIAIVAYIGSRNQYVFVNRAGEGFLRSLRLRLFAHIQRQSLAFFDRNQAGVLVSRMTADIESMSELVQWGLLQFVSASILVSFALVVLLVMSWQLTLLALLVMPFIVVASIRFQRDSNAAYLTVRERIGENLSSLQENITAVRVIQAYAREPEQFRRFRRTNRSLYDAHVAQCQGVHVVLRRGGVLRRAGDRDRDRSRGLARQERTGLGRHRGRRRPAAVEPLRTRSAAVADVQHRPVRDGIAEQDVPDPRHRARGRRTHRCGRAPGRRCAGGRRHQVRVPGHR